MYKCCFVLMWCTSFVFISCEKEVCRNCVRCISYNEKSEIQNEVKVCDLDTVYLKDYKEGFIAGAGSVGRMAICFDLGVECVCE